MNPLHNQLNNQSPNNQLPNKKVIKTKNMKIIEKYLESPSEKIKCGSDTIIRVEIDIDEKTEGEIIFYMKGIIDKKEPVDIGFARYVYIDEPYCRLNTKNNECAYNLNFIRINDCFNGQGLGSILLYYSTDYIFANHKNISQLQLDDDSNLGTSNDPSKRQRSIYRQFGYLHSNTVVKYLEENTPIPEIITNKGPEHLLPINKKHNLKGWKQLRKGKFNKVLSSLRKSFSKPRETRTSKPKNNTLKRKRN
jgi:hypothetical protein